MVAKQQLSFTDWRFAVKRRVKKNLQRNPEVWRHNDILQKWWLDRVQVPDAVQRLTLVIKSMHKGD